LFETLLRVQAQFVARHFPSRNQLIQTAQRAKKSKTGFNFEVDSEYLLATEDSLYAVKDVSFEDEVNVFFVLFF
jgi:hypothetical protein